MHFHSLAILTDGIVRAVDQRKRTLGHFFMEEIVWPLGLDMLIGIPRSQLYRVARTYHTDLFGVVSSLSRLDFASMWTNLWINKWLPFGGIREKAVNVFQDYELLFNWNPDFLESPLPSSHMFTNARNLARLVQLISESATRASNASDKPPFLSSSTLDWMLSPDVVSASHDAVLQRTLALTKAGLMISQSPEGSPIYGMWDDVLNQMVFVDPKRQLTVAYTTNHAHGRSLANDPILSGLVQAVYTCLPPPEAEGSAL